MMWPRPPLPRPIASETFVGLVPYHARPPWGQQQPWIRPPFHQGFGPVPFGHQPSSRHIYGQPHPHFNSPFALANGRGIPRPFAPYPFQFRSGINTGWKAPLSRERAKDVAAKDPDVQKLADTQKQVVSMRGIVVGHHQTPTPTCNEICPDLF